MNMQDFIKQKIAADLDGIPRRKAMYPYRKFLDELEKPMLEYLFEYTNGHKSNMALMMGVSNVRLYSMLAKHGISKPRPYIKYNFGEMDIGDSIIIKGATHDTKEATAAYEYGKRNNVKFSCRHKDGGLHITRIR